MPTEAKRDNDGTLITPERLIALSRGFLDQKMPIGWDADDLGDVLVLAVRAYNGYKPERGGRFSTYFYGWASRFFPRSLGTSPVNGKMRYAKGESFRYSNSSHRIQSCELLESYGYTDSADRIVDKFAFQKALNVIARFNREFALVLWKHSVAGYPITVACRHVGKTRQWFSYKLQQFLELYKKEDLFGN